MNRLRFRFLVFVAVLVLVGPLIAACGGGDDDDEPAAPTAAEEPTATEAVEAEEPEPTATEETEEETGAETTPEATEEPAEEATPTEEATEEAAEEEEATPTEAAMEGEVEPLKIGILVPFSGDLSDFGAAFFDAAQLAVQEINDAGGVNGQPIELVQGDTATAPQQGVEEARRLIEVEGVHAMVGAASSGVSLQVVESVTGPEGMLMISPASTSPALTAVNDNDFFFRTTISDAAQGAILAELASELEYQSACTLYVNNAYGEGLSNFFSESFTEAGGTVTQQVPHEQEQASYSSELSTCTDGDPEVMAAMSYPESAGVYLREAIESGAITEFLFVDGTQSDDMFEELGWDNFEGMYGTAPGALDTEVGAAFDDAYEAEYGERPPLPFLRETYDAIYLIALAAEMADSVVTEDIRDSLRDVANSPGDTINPGPDGWETAVQAIDNGDDINYEGAAGPVDFDDNGDVLVGAIEIWQIEDGDIVVQEVREVDLSE